MKKGFSLMEMMIVLLIVAIIAAASAPMVNKKMVHDAASSSSPWVWTSLTNNSIAFNLDGNDNSTATIGAASTPSGLNSRLYIYSANSSTPHISLKGNDDSIVHVKSADNSILITDKKDDSERDSVIIGRNITPASRSVVLGIDAGGTASDSVIIGPAAGTSANTSDTLVVGFDAVSQGNFAAAVGTKAKAAENATAIGSYSQATGSDSIAIGGTGNSSMLTKASGAGAIALGTQANATGANSVAIGMKTATSGNAVAVGYDSYASNGSTALGLKSYAFGDNSVAIGYKSEANASNSTSLGYYAKAKGLNSIAIGYSANATGARSIAIGYGVNATATNTIVLGTKDDTVIIPGHLVVGRTAYIGNDLKDNYSLYLGMRHNDDSNIKMRPIKMRGKVGGSNNDYNLYSESTVTAKTSDRRLKNVGKIFTGGLEQIKMLEVFNYTYKKDSSNTPHVGIMAQDLQKVFPNAVFKGDDGFLRIRMEDMFYAMINAIKELDAKISYLTDREKRINDLEKQVNSLDKRLTALEKKAK